MKEDKILFKIKTLDKIVLRNFLNSDKVSKNTMPTPTQMRIIKYVLLSKGDVYQKDLEKVLTLRRATVSGVLQTMEKNGLLERKSLENDTRVKQIILKDKAKNIFLEGKKIFEGIEKVMISDISKEELDSFSNTLDKMIKNIEGSNVDDKII